MKTPQKILLLFLYVLTASWSSAQNSTCGSPSGAMQQPDSVTATCFTGYTEAASGPLTQFYTFIATSADMAAELTPDVGTSCSFPNTAINYSNFQLYNSADCGTLLSSSPSFSGLSIGVQYTFGLTMTPQDPACVWIAQACPRVVDVTIPLGADLLYYTGSVDHAEVKLSWDIPEGPMPQEFQVLRRTSPLETFSLVGTVNAESRGQYGYTWVDPQPLPGQVQYVLDLVDQNGHRNRSDVMELEVQANHLLQVFPNPCHNHLQVRFPEGSDQIYTVTVCNIYGGLSKELKGTATTINAALPNLVATLSPGTYLLQCQDGKVRNSAKFIKI